MIRRGGGDEEKPIDPESKTIALKTAAIHNRHLNLRTIKFSNKILPLMFEN